MNNIVIDISVDRLRDLIGNEVHYDGKACQIIEILEDGPSLILQHSDLLTHIQPDQHGEARRKVPTTVTIPVLDQERNTYSKAFRSLNLHTLL